MTATTTSTGSSTDLSSQLAQAAQSIISGATSSTLDVDTLVQSLVTAKTAGQTTAITNKQASDTAEISAIGQIKSALSALQTAVAGFTDGSALSQVKATMSGSGITATPTTGAGPGTYSVNVSQIATASSFTSAGIASGTPLAAGTMTINLGSSSSMQVSVTAGESLSDVASSINKSGSNPGVNASVITSTDNTGSKTQYLVITSTKTGLANSISVSTTNNSQLTTGSTGVSTVAGQDAKLTINGLNVVSSSNTVDSALTGITLDVSQATLNTSQTLSVAVDTTAQTTAINNFVTAYNSFKSTISGLTSYDTSSSTAGPLLGDAMTNTISNGLASLVSSGVTSSGATYSLSSIGIDLQPDGTLVADSTKLQTALTSNSATVNALFNSVNGMGAKLDDFANTYTQSSGTIDQRTSALQTDLNNLSDQQTQLTNYQDTLTTQYNAQFTALNNLMAQMQNNTRYLTQLFGGQSSAGTLATNK
ncbi:flagellar filament capping protein FliD [Paraburkholderia hospita]|uniref:flagellar filament capping protein FliD n=1 Tax=Paraburkholderia hospita TaxID=169430 RepID=UPI000271D755|nr:flagellar filament capping protein FliD [Paraburkholderia hospita]EUC21294.1 flagellar hook-associated 2 domain-containing protein [Burkholderia sp. BT03]SKC94864.1 flagellar hook-associated protein 2 [Paraburkholderia hospita]